MQRDGAGSPLKQEPRTGALVDSTACHPYAGLSAHILRMQRAEWTSLRDRIRRHLQAVMADGMPGWLQQRLLAIPRAVDVLDTARTPEPDVGATIRAALEEVDERS